MCVRARVRMCMYIMHDMEIRSFFPLPPDSVTSLIRDNSARIQALLNCTDCLEIDLRFLRSSGTTSKCDQMRFAVLTYATITQIYEKYFAV